jgi:hypothetical protein
MKHSLSIFLLTSIIVSSPNLFAQDSAQTCKVEPKDLMGTYSGECKNGWAHGKGEAKGNHRYNGNFKSGLPHGEGIYYYSDSVYHKGKFQDGVKEGKGQTYYLRNGLPDSVVKGYWSGNEYRGKNYITYNYIGGPRFDRAEFEPSSEGGKTLTIEVSVFPSDGSSVTVSELYSTDGSFIRKLDAFKSTNKSTAIFEINKYPVNLQVIFSTGQTMSIELYKNARWSVRFWLLK